MGSTLQPFCLACETTMVSRLGFELLSQLGLSIWALHHGSTGEVRTLRWKECHEDLHLSYSPSIEAYFGALRRPDLQ